MRNAAFLIAIFLLGWGWGGGAGSALGAADAGIPPDPGFEASLRMADAVAEVEILSGGPFRAAALSRKVLKGQLPRVFELAGFNSVNWDTVHKGFASGSRWILMLSATGQPGVFAPLTPAAPRLSVQQDGVMLTLGDPSFSIPVKRRAVEDGLLLLLEAYESGQTPARADAFLKTLWDDGGIESRYWAVALAGALRDSQFVPLLGNAAREKLLKLRLTAIEALGKTGTPAAFGALRALLKDEKASVAREAARVLAGAGDAEAVPELLDWLLRYAAKSAPKASGGAASPASTERAKNEAVAQAVLGLAYMSAPLLERAEAVRRLLLQIARASDELCARGALQVLSACAGAPEIEALLELAEDRTYEWNAFAAAALQRAVLKYFRDAAEFRRWWTLSGKTFGEDDRRLQAEAYARGAARTKDGEEKRRLLDLLRAAPGEIALVSSAPLLLNAAAYMRFSAEDVEAWNTPLNLPFLLERLAWPDGAGRAAALQALVRLCAQQPRLKHVLWPLAAACVSDDDDGVRRVAHAAVGLLMDRESVPALLDAVQHCGGCEGADAARAIYALSARTLAFSAGEPLPDQEEAARRLRGWWEAARNTFKPQAAPAFGVSVFGGQEPFVRAEKLERAVQAPDSRVSSAAFGALLAERSAADPLWPRLLAQSRQRDIAHGILGLIGGDEVWIRALAERLGAAENLNEAPLCRAMSLVVLPSLKAHAGAGQAAQWLAGPGARADIPWRRLAVLALGYAGDEPASLARLGEILKQSQSIEAASDGLDGSENRPLLRAALLALCARADSTGILVQALPRAGSCLEREMLIRELSRRRVLAAVPAMLESLGKSGKREWYALCRRIEPLLAEAHGPAIRSMLDAANAVKRSAAAYFMAARPELWRLDETGTQLQAGLADSSNLVRRFCAQALGRRRIAGSTAKLVMALADDDEDVRAEAAEALGLIGDKRACQAAALAAEREIQADARWLRSMAVAGGETNLRTVMRLCDSNVFVSQRAGLEALAAAPAETALPRLLKTFRDDESALQTAAGEALAQFGAAAAASIRGDLRHSERAVRARAILLLARIDDPASHAALKLAATDADESLRALAQFALKRVQDLALKRQQAPGGGR